MTNLNEAFAPNMTGKEIELSIQPYYHVKGTVTKITPRRIETKEFISGKGRCIVSYEVFDCEITVSSGWHVGSLVAGVPQRSSVEDMSGRVLATTMNYGELHRGCVEGKHIVQASCG